MAAEEESGLMDSPRDCSEGSSNPFLAAMEVSEKRSVKEILIDGGGGQKKEPVCLSE